MKKRTIAAITGSRAEAGLLITLLRLIRDDSHLQLQLIVTGSHLSNHHGNTFDELSNAGLQIDAKVEMLLDTDSPVAICKSIGLGVIGFADALRNLNPDLILVLGDRYEIFAAVQAALILKIPVAHIHGGEVSFGAIDESIRHAITKMAHIHFVAAKPYYERVKQLGECPHTIFNYGAPGLDKLLDTNYMAADELARELKFNLEPKVILVTYHPPTLSEKPIPELVNGLLGALRQKIVQGYHIIFTKANADAKGQAINKLISEFVNQHKAHAILVDSLGHYRYLSVLSIAEFVIGNSSSGLTEAPLLKKPSINLGSRQNGRLKADSVIDCNEDMESILFAMELVESNDFKQKTRKVNSLYGYGDASLKIKDKLKHIDLHGIITKKFYDYDLELK